MRNRIKHPAFQNKILEIEGSHFWSKPIVYLDGEEVIFKRNVTKVLSDSGLSVEINFKPNPFKYHYEFNINGEKVLVGATLKFLDKILMSLPFLLFFGGLIGGALALLGIYLNIYLFRELTYPVSFIRLLALGLFLVLGLIYFFIALALQLL